MESNYINVLNNFLDKKGKLYEDRFGKYSKIYSMTTENIYGFLKNFDLKDKKVLTVTGSGDQMLNSYLLGASSVTCFDINPNAFLHTKLKTCAIKNLKFSDFLAFFNIIDLEHYNNYLPLDKRIFDKLVPYIDFDTFNLYDFLYSKYRPNEICQKLYYNFSSLLFKLEEMNGYLDSDSYKNLSQILIDKRIDFIETDVNNLKKEIGNNKYDMILLSNISDYLVEMYDKNCLEKFRELIYSLSDNLNEYGTIQVGYIYNYIYRSKENNPFRIKKERPVK